MLKIKFYFRIPSPSLSSALSSIAGRFTTNEEIAALEAFGASTADLSASVKASIVTSVQNARTSVAWDAKYITVVREYLEKKDYGSATSVSMSLAMTMTTLMVVYLLQ